MRKVGDRAVVLGTRMARLLSAGVLADACQRVTQSLSNTSVPATIRPIDH